MGTYYITLAAVAFFGALAQICEKRNVEELCWGRVKHTPPAFMFFWIAAAVLIVVAGLRYRVGADFGAYYQCYSDTEDLIHRFLALEEPGFYALAYIATMVFHQPVAVTFSAAAVTLGVILATMYRNTDCLLLGLVLVFFTVWDGCFNGVRQYLAVAFVFAGFSFLRDERFWPYALCVAVAFLFHRAALVMICIYPVCHMEITARNLAVLTVGALVILFSFEQVLRFTGWLLNSDSESLADGETIDYITNAVNPLRIAAGVAPAIAGMIYYWNKPRGQRETFYLDLLTVCGIVRLASAGSTYIARIAIFTSPFLIMAIPQLLKPVPKQYRGFVTAVVVALYGIMWWYEASKSGSLNHWQWVPELANF